MFVKAILCGRGVCKGVSKHRGSTGEQHSYLPRSVNFYQLKLSVNGMQRMQERKRIGLHFVIQRRREMRPGLMATYYQSHKLIIHINVTKSSIECRSKAIRFLTSNSVSVVVFRGLQSRFRDCKYPTIELIRAHSSDYIRKVQSSEFLLQIRGGLSWYRVMSADSAPESQGVFT